MENGIPVSGSISGNVLQRMSRHAAFDKYFDSSTQYNDFVVRQSRLHATLAYIYIVRHK